jgi:hypothetical protein
MRLRSTIVVPRNNIEAPISEPIHSKSHTNEESEDFPMNDSEAIALFLNATVRISNGRSLKADDLFVYWTSFLNEKVKSNNWPNYDYLRNLENFRKKSTSLLASFKQGDLNVIGLNKLKLQKNDYITSACKMYKNGWFQNLEFIVLRPNLLPKFSGHRNDEYNDGQGSTNDRSEGRNENDVKTHQGKQSVQKEQRGWKEQRDWKDRRDVLENHSFHSRRPLGLKYQWTPKDQNSRSEDVRKEAKERNLVEESKNEQQRLKDSSSRGLEKKKEEPKQSKGRKRSKVVESTKTCWNQNNSKEHQSINLLPSKRGKVEVKSALTPSSSSFEVSILNILSESKEDLLSSLEENSE